VSSGAGGGEGKMTDLRRDAVRVRGLGGGGISGMVVEVGTLGLGEGERMEAGGVDSGI
jgi:hypothetical protein